jgi:hypothetical protein
VGRNSLSRDRPQPRNQSERSAAAVVGKNHQRVRPAQPDLHVGVGPVRAAAVSDDLPGFDNPESETVLRRPQLGPGRGHDLQEFGFDEPAAAECTTKAQQVDDGRVGAAGRRTLTFSRKYVLWYATPAGEVSLI